MKHSVLLRRFFSQKYRVVHRLFSESRETTRLCMHLHAITPLSFHVLLTAVEVNEDILLFVSASMQRFSISRLPLIKSFTFAGGNAVIYWAHFLSCCETINQIANELLL